MKRVTRESYREDVHDPRVVKAVAAILSRGTVVAPVDVLVEMGLLKKSALEDWRFGRVPYLERVINCNLEKLSRILRILAFHAHDLGLKPSHTAYVKWGKGRRHPSRFSKTGDAGVEQAYSRHFVRQGEKAARTDRAGAEGSDGVAEPGDGSNDTHVEREGLGRR